MWYTIGPSDIYFPFVGDYIYIEREKYINNVFQGYLRAFPCRAWFYRKNYQHGDFNCGRRPFFLMEPIMPKGKLILGHSGVFSAQKASHVEMVSIWWHHHGTPIYIWSSFVSSEINGILISKVHCIQRRQSQLSQCYFIKFAVLCPQWHHMTQHPLRYKTRYKIRLRWYILDNICPTHFNYC